MSFLSPHEEEEEEDRRPLPMGNKEGLLCLGPDKLA